ncbi:bifunctional protein-serine/threonine kinase/phosphatase [Hydrogenovibrio sp. 3SP14C1]|uniref:bifunctional protein-serine/threonine kinase/phosphatase n=1 Tax=Hydrogenovibrio sp. 3SP14C1 TaxID=3038774 RepID=UPI002416C8D6|nr:bifunctional protein-serine/threonine kinase/phosphatase [Hydrogenovibrio sp. 3SP14C1]MDG4811464.1 bifunctional protein-serine/threonine kinase/phosphatase [Hydrogenovibrio sp. 3SP14C1]
MENTLNISIGQHSDKGRKPINQDFYGVYTPKEPLLSTKGISIALADGISSSQVSQEASESAVSSFLADYYCTSDAWSVKTSAYKVLLAINAWLHAQTRSSQYRFDKNKGYVCTFSALILKSNTAHLFHAGDSRIYRLNEQNLEQLTEDHRMVVSENKSYLSRALGVHDYCEIDYQSFLIEVNDLFILATDGIYEFVEENQIIKIINHHSNDLDKAAKLILDTAYEHGSDDNLTIQIVRIDSLPSRNKSELYQQINHLPFPQQIAPRTEMDGYHILREIYISSRSHVYLAEDIDTQQQVIIKLPSVEKRSDTHYLERFLMEEWIARRLNNPHVLKAYAPTRKRHYFYITTEFIEGQTLDQWMRDHPKPDIETVRDIVEQISKGLNAFHRQEMIHQDLRPNNIMIDQKGTVKIIDFGATHVAGLAEINNTQPEILGTAAYTAPEYFLGQAGTSKSDLFSLAVITYQMLSGKLPYGTEVAKARTKTAQRNLTYRSVLNDDQEIPAWIDDALKKALHPDPYRRYGELSELIFDLRHPNRTFLNKTRAPLMERHPVLFWKSTSFILFLMLLGLLIHQN